MGGIELAGGPWVLGGTAEVGEERGVGYASHSDYSCPYYERVTVALPRSVRSMSGHVFPSMYVDICAHIDTHTE